MDEPPCSAQADAILAAALRSVPRRHRLPLLQWDPAWPPTRDPDAALACAIEGARVAQEAGRAPAPTNRALFLAALAAQLRVAAAPAGGDPALRLAALRVHDAPVREHAALVATAADDRRAMRMLVDAAAHPGKLRGLPATPARDAAAQLHTLASSGDWAGLRAGAERLLALADAAPWHALAAAVRDAPALARLEREADLRRLPAVQHALALAASVAGAARANGSGGADRRGRAAERATEAAFGAIAGVLDAACGGARRHRVVHGLRTPAGWPGDRARSKDEWDVALLREDEAGDAFDVVLLAEVKAGPAAVVADLPRLLRGLRQLAQAADGAHRFASSDGEVMLQGRSLRALQPGGREPPPHVVYACPAAATAPPRLLDAGSRAVLWNEPASLAAAWRVGLGEAIADGDLLPVWEALLHAPRLHGVLAQGETARIARAAALDPHELLEAVRRG
jgi:hypothetical protein